MTPTPTPSPSPYRVIVNIHTDPDGSPMRHEWVGLAYTVVEAAQQATMTAASSLPADIFNSPDTRLTIAQVGPDYSAWLMMIRAADTVNK